MNDNLKKQISYIDDLNELSDIISQSTELKESIFSYAKEPFDSIFSGDKGKASVGFHEKGDTIYLLGDYSGREKDNSSTLEIALDAADQGLLASAHLIQGKGLFIGLIESSALNKLGFDITSISEIEEKEFLFNDKNSSILVSVKAAKESEFVDYMFNNGVEVTLLGHVTKGELRMDDFSFGFIEDFI
jgi:hypothetical protein